MLLLLLLSVFFQGAMRLLSILLLPLATLSRIVRGRLHVIRLGAKFPGPISFPIVGNSLDAWSFNSEALFVNAMEQYFKYAPLMRAYVGPWLLVISAHPRDNEVILSGYKFLNKSYLYNKFLDPWLGNGLLTSRGEKWRSRRKVLTPAFHFRILEQFAPIFRSCSDEFVRQLRQRAGGASFDMWQHVKLLTLDVICVASSDDCDSAVAGDWKIMGSETAMGVKLNAQTHSSSAYVNAVEEISSITLKRALQPWFYYNDSIFYLTPMGRKYKKCLEVLHGTTDKVIRDRKEEFQKISEDLGQDTFDIDELGRRRRVAFLDLLLMAARDGGLSHADIREEVDTFMFEGHDTTASALSFTFYLLSLHEDVQEKILEELKSVFDWSQPLEPSLQQLSELKYLEMVIKESLRLYPPVGIILRDITEDQQLPTTGHVIPAGGIKVIPVFGIHRNPEHFSDPEKFDPERFSPEQSAGRHPYAYVPFSAGPRNCIGQRFAMLELKSVMAKVLWNFRILPEPGFEPILVWELIARSKNGVRVRLEDRRPH